MKFSPVFKISSIRIVLTLAASVNLEVEQQLNIKAAFLYGNLDETIYVMKRADQHINIKNKNYI